MPRFVKGGLSSMTSKFLNSEVFTTESQKHIKLFFQQLNG